MSKGISISSSVSHFVSRIKLRPSFLGLTRRFRIMILSNVFESFTSPNWLSIYLKKDLGASDRGIGIVNSVQSGVGLFLWPAGAAFGQRFSKKRLYLLGLIMQASAYLVAFLAKDWTWAILMSIILGCSTVVLPGISALIGKITDRGTRTSAFAFQDTVISIVLIISGVLQGFIAQKAGLRPLYLLAVAGPVISFFIFLVFFPDVGEEENGMDKDETESQSKARASRHWKEQVQQVFARPEYRQNFIGVLQAGVVWRLFIQSMAPFIDIYLYEEIGWSFVFFGLFSSINSFLALVLRIPIGRFIDKHNLKRVCFAGGQIFSGFVYLLMVFVRDPYLLAILFLIRESITGAAHTLSVMALWYDAIPLEVYPIGAAIRGVIYGFFGMVGPLLGAYMWSNIGPIMSFYIMSATYIISALVAYWLIRDIKDEK